MLRDLCLNISVFFFPSHINLTQCWSICPKLQLQKKKDVIPSRKERSDLQCTKNDDNSRWSMYTRIQTVDLPQPKAGHWKFIRLMIKVAVADKKVWLLQIWRAPAQLRGKNSIQAFTIEGSYFCGWLGSQLPHRAREGVAYVEGSVKVDSSVLSD